MCDCCSASGSAHSVRSGCEVGLSRSGPLQTFRPQFHGSAHPFSCGWPATRGGSHHVRLSQKFTVAQPQVDPSYPQQNLSVGPVSGEIGHRDPRHASSAQRTQYTDRADRSRTTGMITRAHIRRIPVDDTGRQRAVALMEILQFHWVGPLGS